MKVFKCYLSCDDFGAYYSNMIELFFFSIIYANNALEIPLYKAKMFAYRYMKTHCKMLNSNTFNIQVQISLRQTNDKTSTSRR